MDELSKAGIDISGILPEDMPGLDNFETLKGYLDYIKTEAPELYSALAVALPDEVDRVTEDMGVTIGNVTLADGATLPAVEGLEGVIDNVKAGEELNIDDVLPAATAIVAHYTNGASEEEIAKLDPPVTALITAYQEMLEGNASPESFLSALTAYISYYNDETARRELTENPLEIQANVTYNPLIVGEIVTGANTKKDIPVLGSTEVQRINQVTQAMADYNEELETSRNSPFEVPVDPLRPLRVSNEIYNFPEEDAKHMLDFMGEYKKMVSSGEAPDEATQAYAKTITDFVTQMAALELPEDQQHLVENLLAPFKELFGTEDNESLSTYIESMATLGTDMIAGVGTGIAGFDFSTDAALATANAKTSLSTAVVNEGDSIKGVGTNIAAGVAAGMAGYDFTAAALAMITNAKTATDKAAGIASPAKKFIPEGYFSAAGVGLGMRGYDFTQDAQETAQHIARSLIGEMETIRVPNLVAIAEEYDLRAEQRTARGGGYAPAGDTIEHNTSYEMGGISVNYPQFKSETDMHRMMTLMDEETRRKINGVGG